MAHWLRQTLMAQVCARFHWTLTLVEDDGPRGWAGTLQCKPHGQIKFAFFWP